MCDFQLANVRPYYLNWPQRIISPKSAIYARYMNARMSLANANVAYYNPGRAGKSVASYLRDARSWPRAAKTINHKIQRW